MISDTNTHMLAFLADVLHDRKPEKISPNEWTAMLEELHAQAVDALPSEAVLDLGLSAEEKARYRKTVIRNSFAFHLLMEEQKRILSVLEAAQIPTVVIKGAVAAANYPNPENRCMGDIDLLVMRTDFERAYNALVSAGCESEQTPEDFRRHIRLLTETGVEIELHNYFSSSNNAKQNALLDEMLDRAIPFRKHVEVSGYYVPVLPDLENGLVLLGHINQHIFGGLGLRQIVDWMYYVEKTLDDAFWENGFAEKAEQIGMKRLAMIVTAMCQKYLGLQKDIHWCDYEPVCDELMEYILDHGNFGRKVEGTKSRTTAVLNILRNPIRGLIKAQNCGLQTWKACKKHRWLRPFAWFYQLIRWAKHGIQSGVNFGILNAASSSVKENVDLLSKLDVTRL